MEVSVWRIRKMSNRFEVGQLVYVVYRVKNKKGVRKWHVADGKRKIVDIKNKYFFNGMPDHARFCDVFSSLEEAISQCNYRNNWDKYHNSKDYRGTHKKKST